MAGSKVAACLCLRQACRVQDGPQIGDDCLLFQDDALCGAQMSLPLGLLQPELTLQYLTPKLIPSTAAPDRERSPQGCTASVPILPESVVPH